jgi:hypothetical protein
MLLNVAPERIGSTHPPVAKLKWVCRGGKRRLSQAQLASFSPQESVVED